MKNTSSIEEILAKEPDGLILSGGPMLERAGNCSVYVKKIDQSFARGIIPHEMIC